jgi:uncharacterized protein
LQRLTEDELKEEIMAEKQTYTLITGASLGIGKAMAIECASRGMNLILVALPGDELVNTAVELAEKYSIDVLHYATDLTKEGNIKALHDWYLIQNVQIDFLINNAGLGTSGWLTKMDINLIHTMLKLNNDALTSMCYYFIPELKKNKQSWILNVGSLESFLPIPYKAVYTGTKQYNYGFTLALREELKHFGISVSLLCPGAVVTNEEGLNRIKSQGAKAKLMVTMPDFVAKRAIKRTLERKNIIVPGRMNKIIRKFSMLFPTSLRMKILEKVFRVYAKESDKITSASN